MNRMNLIIGGIVLIAILAGAAFIGAQMVSRTSEAEASSPGGVSGRVMEMVHDDGNGAFGVRVSFKPAAELPDRPAEVGGIFIKREDNTVFVGTGDIEMDVDVDGNTGQQTVTANHTGPIIEVVVTQDTAIYRDVTEIDIEPEARQSGEQTIQQIVQPDESLEGLTDNTELEVWGEKRGDRVVAEVVVYRLLGE